MKALKPIGLGLTFATFAICGLALTYHVAGGNFDPASRTSVSINSRGGWGFDTMVGCGPRGSTYVTRIGPLEIARHYGR